MQTHGGQAAAIAIESKNRAFAISLTVDWNRDGLFTHPLSDLSAYVDEITTDRSLRGSAPEELLLIEGSAAAELTAVIHGNYNGLSFAGVFSPYNAASPLYGKDVMGAEIRYKIGVETAAGTIWYSQFIGQVRTASPDRADGAVEITALDRAELLRRPISMPVWALSREWDHANQFTNQLIYSHWVIDHCLRQCDTSPTPYRPTTREELGVADDSPHGPQLWVSGNGSVLPTIGWMGNIWESTFPADNSGLAMYAATAPPHPASPEPATAPLALAAIGANPGEWTTYVLHDRDMVWDDKMHYLGLTFVTIGPNATQYLTSPDVILMAVFPGSKYRYSIGLQAGKIRSVLRRDNVVVATSPEVAIPATGSAHRVSVIWDAFNSAGPRVSVQVGSNSTNGWVTLGGPIANQFDDDEQRGKAWLFHRHSLCDAYYATLATTGQASTSDSIGIRPAKYAAVLDQGKGRLTHLAAESGNDAWDTITEIAAAEWGAVFWDENGIFRFWNRDRIAGLQSSVVRTLTLDEVSGLRLTNTLDSVRNIYSIKAKRRTARSETVYKSQDPDEFYVPGSTEKTFRFKVDKAIAAISEQPFRRKTSLFYKDHYHSYGVQWFKNNAWAEDDTKGQVDIRAGMDRNGLVTVTIWNGYSEPCRLALNPKEAAFNLGGSVVADDGQQVHTTKNLPSIQKYGGRNLALSSDWHQETFNATQLVTSMITKTGKPTPTTDAITIAGDPRLQLGDTIRITDPDAMGDLTVQVYGIRRTYGPTSGLTDTLTVELVRPPG